jgi:hypothetical protein
MQVILLGRYNSSLAFYPPPNIIQQREEKAEAKRCGRHAQVEMCYCMYGERHHHHYFFIGEIVGNRWVCECSRERANASAT